MKRSFYLLIFLFIFALVVPCMAIGPYTDNGDGTVTDKGTGLMWQQSDDGKTRTWKEALSYCENLEFAGYNDWRLPTLQELKSIVKFGDAPTIDTTYFSCKSSRYWSSTYNPVWTSVVWNVNFSNGLAYNWLSYSLPYVRCVRGEIVDNSGDLCDFDHLSNCKNSTDCEDVGGYWWNNKCNKEEQKQAKLNVETSIDFGNKEVGGDYYYNLIIYNKGEKDLNIDAIYFSSNPDNVFKITNLQDVSISPGSSFTYKIKFSPGEESTYTGTLVLNSNDPDNEEVKITLKGKGKEAEVEEKELDAEVLDMFNIYLNGKYFYIRFKTSEKENLCDNYKFQVSGNEYNVKEIEEDMCIQNSEKSNEYIVKFIMNPSNINNKAIGFEDGKFIMCKKTDANDCYKIPINNFNVYGTLFEDEHKSFDNSDYLKEIDNDILQKLASFFMVKIPTSKVFDFYDSVFTLGLCYGIESEVIANFCNDSENGYWGNNLINLDYKNNNIKWDESWKQAIDKHWDSNGKKANPPFKPFKEDLTYKALNESKEEAIGKTMYYFLSQGYFANNLSNWVGKDKDYKELDRENIIKMLKKGKLPLINIKIKKKKYFIFNQILGEHALGLIEMISWNNKDIYFFHDNNGNKVRYYEDSDKNWNIKTVDLNREGWDAYSSLEFKTKYLLARRPRYLPAESSSQGIYGNEPFTNEFSSVNNFAQNSDSNTIEWSEPEIMSIQVIGGKVLKVTEKESGNEINLISEGDVSDTKGSITTKAGGMYSKILLKADKIYKIELEKISYLPYLQVYVIIPNGDGTAKILNYDHLEIDENDSTKAYFYAGRNNDETTATRVSGSKTESYSPDVDIDVNIKINPLTDFKGLYKNNNAELSWENPKNSNFVGVVIVRNTSRFPDNVNDGTQIYDGKGEKTTDYNIDKNKTYYYAAFSYDTNGHYSDPVYTYAVTNEESYSIYGVVSDENGKNVTGCEITLSDNDKNQLDVDYTDKNGKFVFSSIKNGEYQLSVSCEGFTSESGTKNVTVKNGSEEIDFSVKSENKCSSEKLDYCNSETDCKNAGGYWYSNKCNATPESTDNNDNSGLSLLPDTGQDKCYDDSKEIPCPKPGEDFYGQDGNYKGLQQSFEKKEINGDLVVIDKNTGLMWQQADDGVKRDWYDAKDYCESLSLAGYDDWRLPTLFELTTIVNYGEHDPAIDESYFSSESAYYWSATTNAGSTYDAWNVYFYYGFDYYWDKSNLHYVRCCRSGLLKIGSFKTLVISGDKVVKDTTTGLMWQQATADINGDGEISPYDWANPGPDQVTWKEALSYCENLDFAGYSDWRLPNIQELRSIVKYDTYDPAIDTSYFSCKSSYYWSATTNVDSTYNAWFVFFHSGVGNVWFKSVSNYVRCVRSGLIGNSGDLCDSDHLSNCNNETDCENAGGYWYNSKCNSTPKEINAASISPREPTLYNRNNPTLPTYLSVEFEATSKVKIQPTMNIPTYAQGRSGTAILYIYMPEVYLWISFPSVHVTSLGSTYTFKNISRTIDFTNASGMNFQVWYGLSVDSLFLFDYYEVMVK